QPREVHEFGQRREQERRPYRPEHLAAKDGQIRRWACQQGNEAALLFLAGKLAARHANTGRRRQQTQHEQVEGQELPGVRSGGPFRRAHGGGEHEGREHDAEEEPHEQRGAVAQGFERAAPGDEQGRPPGSRRLGQVVGDTPDRHRSPPSAVTIAAPRSSPGWTPASSPSAVTYTSSSERVWQVTATTCAPAAMRRATTAGLTSRGWAVR